MAVFISAPISIPRSTSVDARVWYRSRYENNCVITSKYRRSGWNCQMISTLAQHCRSGVSNLFDQRAKCTNFKLVMGQIEMTKASRGKGMGRGVSLPNRLRGLGSVVSSPTGIWGGVLAWRILELEKHHLIDTNLSFLTFLGNLAGRIEMPGGPDCARGLYVGHSCCRSMM